MSRRLLTIIVLALPAVGGVVGYFGGPLLARASDTVKLAERIYEEDSTGLDERTLESEAFRATGQPTEELFAEARGVERRFTVTGDIRRGSGCVPGLWTLLHVLSAGTAAPQGDGQDGNQVTGALVF